MNEHADNSRNGPLDFTDRCEECAGFCCIALEIPKESAGTLVKTANKVCEFLDMDPSGVWHACSAYHSRRSRWFETCLQYRCYGSGAVVSAAAMANEWILSDGTFTKEAVDLYDLCYRLASYLWGNAELAEAALFPIFIKKPDEFDEACERIYRKFLEEGIWTDAQGAASDIAEVRDWFIAGIRWKRGPILRFFDRIRKEPDKTP